MESLFERFIIIIISLACTQCVYNTLLAPNTVQGPENSFSLKSVFILCYFFADNTNTDSKS